MQIVALTILLLIGVLAEAQTSLSQAPLSELAIYNRCYAHLTQKDLPLKHPNIELIRAGTLKGVDACIQLLESAKLNSSGSREGFLLNDNLESRLVLRTFNDLHRTWFPSDSLTQAIAFEDITYRTGLVIDETEPALHVTRVLLTAGMPFSTVVVGSESVEALRTNGPSLYDQNLSEIVNGVQLNYKIKHKASMDPAAVSVNLNPPLIQTGELIGVRRMSLNSSKENLTANTNFIAPPGNILPGPLKINESSGGGIIGTKSYMMLNLGATSYRPPDGGIIMSRRWSKNLLNDLLCRGLPVVRSGDALPLVQTAITTATPSFRKTPSCVRCHSTIDPMAATARNVSFAWTTAPLFGGIHSLVKWPVSLPAENSVVDADKDYFKRPPNGRLFYRNYKGDLIDRPVSGIQDLGQALAETEDLYICTAAKYLEFFTGIKLSLSDPGDPDNSGPIDPANKVYGDYAIRLGKNLMSDQNLANLIKDILRSELYRKNSMRASRK